MKKRLGCGLHGYEDIKTHEYFQAGHTTSTVFNKILGRELDPPVPPIGSVEFLEEDDLAMTLDDAHELG